MLSLSTSAIAQALLLHGRGQRLDLKPWQPSLVRSIDDSRLALGENDKLKTAA
jgi:hypothetical protein